MELSPSLEAASHSDPQEFPISLLNPEFHYGIHNSSSLSNSCCTYISVLVWICHANRKKQELIAEIKKLRGLSPRANYTGRSTAACRRN